MFNKFRTLGTYLPFRGIRLTKEDFDCVFPFLDKGLSALYKGRSAVPIVFRFYTTGTFERVIGDLFDVSVCATFIVIHKVSKAIEKRREHFLSFR